MVVLRAVFYFVAVELVEPFCYTISSFNYQYQFFLLKFFRSQIYCVLMLIYMFKICFRFCFCKQRMNQREPNLIQD